MAGHLPDPDTCMTVGQLRDELRDVPDATPVVIWDELGSWEAGYSIDLSDPSKFDHPVFRIAGGSQLDSADDRVT